MLGEREKEDEVSEVKTESCGPFWERAGARRPKEKSLRCFSPPSPLEKK